jgi:hypothetical protein
VGKLEALLLVRGCTSEHHSSHHHTTHTLSNEAPSPAITQDYLTRSGGLPDNFDASTADDCEGYSLPDLLV